MHHIMTELHQDHINLARLLQLLQQQVTLLADGEDADLPLMSDIADYIRRYSDGVHHPKEDEIYKVLRLHEGAAGLAIDELLTEHQRLPDVTEEFQQLLDGVLNGDAIISRQGLQDKITAFIEHQYDHMNLEEAEVFPLIHNVLQAADWTVVEGNIEVAHDPLFGTHVADRYQTLYQYVSA